MKNYNEDDCIPLGKYTIRAKTHFELTHGESLGLRFLPEFYLTDDEGNAYLFVEDAKGNTTFQELKGKEAETAATQPGIGTLVSGE